MSIIAAYPASEIKRRRASKDELEERAAFLIDYAEKHGPVTVRQLYYQAEVHGVPGIDKTQSGYNKVQWQVLELRRAGRLAYHRIADMICWMRKPNTHNGVAHILYSAAATYRKALWNDANKYVEIWCEKDALAGAIYPVTAEYDAPLMVSRGFASETFCYEAISQRGEDDRPYHVYYLGDFDRSGLDAARALNEKLARFAEEKGLDVVFEQIAVNADQITELGLRTRPPKRESAADKKWPHAFACELDAMAPVYVRDLVELAINRHLDQRELHILKVAEASEREQLRMFCRETRP